MSNKNIDQFISKPLGNTVVQQRRHHALQTSASSFGKGGWEGGDGKFWRNFFVTFAFQVFAVNVFSQFWCIYEFLPRMLTLNMVKNSSIMMDNIDTLAIWSPQGHIVSMSSMAGVTGTPNLVPYCASKVFFPCCPFFCKFLLKGNWQWQLSSLLWGAWWRPSILSWGQTTLIQRYMVSYFSIFVVWYYWL